MSSKQINTIEKANITFKEVRDHLHTVSKSAFRLCFLKPMSFYSKNSKEDVIKILLEEAEAKERTP